MAAARSHNRARSPSQRREPTPFREAPPCAGVAAARLARGAAASISQTPRGGRHLAAGRLPILDGGRPQGRQRLHARPLRPPRPPAAQDAGGSGGLVRYDPLRAYMAEVARHPLLTREEEHELADALPRDGRPRGRLPARRLEPAPRGEDRPRVPPHRVPAPGPRPGGQHRPDAGGEEVRPVAGREAVVLRRLVDPRVHPPLHHGQLADGEARHHPGAAEALLQPAQGAGEAPRAGHRAHPEAAREEPQRRRAGRRGDGRAAGGRRALARRARAGDDESSAVAARPGRGDRRARGGRAARRTSSCAGSSARSSRRSRRRSPTRRSATSSSSGSSAGGTDAAHAPGHRRPLQAHPRARPADRGEAHARLRAYLRAEIPDFELLGPPES